MNEGLLKKRMVAPYLEADEHVCPKEIGKAIDGAKKEYPYAGIYLDANELNKITGQKVSAGTILTKGRYIELLIKYIKMKDEWFIKNFGESDV